MTSSSKRLRIFLSAVSSQFKDCREALASDLRAIGCEVRVQEDFQQGPRSLIERLEEYVAACDRVVALVGDTYGSEASGNAVPAVVPPRSYTQWEYFFAMGERLDGHPVAPTDLYVYLASDEYLRAHSARQPDDHAARQRRFVEGVKESGKHWGQFHSFENLCRLVLRDGWQMRERPPRPSNLPYSSIGKLFKGRQPKLDELHRLLWRSGATEATVALHGLGGIGKTRLAVEYALCHRNEYSALLFASATTPESLDDNLANLCAPRVLNLPEQEARKEAVRVAAALRWLDEHPGWLLILDSVDAPNAAKAVEERLVQLLGGHVILTTRLEDWSGGVELLYVDELNKSDSVAFLLERTDKRRRTSRTDEKDALALAKELGGLALALEQAGAFISKLRGSLGDYLRRWREHEPKVRTWHDATLMAYPRPLAVTWDTTVSQLDAAAFALLKLLSWLAPDPIPRALLETEAAREVLLAATSRLVEQHRPTELDPEDALAMLAGFSLIKYETGNKAFRVHRLVQELTRDRLAAGERDDCVRGALDLFDAYLPGEPPPQDVRSWPKWESVRPHAEAVLGSADAVAIHERTGRLMNELGIFLMAKALHAHAEPMMRRALAIGEARYGSEHPNVAASLINLAQLLQDTNRLGEAEPLMRRALAIDEASYGTEHPNVATCLNNLALLLQETNRLGEAEPLMRRVMAIDEASYGPEHPKVARAHNNLAQLLKATNRLAEAEPLMRRALAISKASYGPEHPAVAIALNNLAQLLEETNRPGEAAPLMRRMMEIFLHFTRRTGHPHPKLETGIANYARLLRAMGRSDAEITQQLETLVAKEVGSPGQGRGRPARGRSGAPARRGPTPRARRRGRGR